MEEAELRRHWRSPFLAGILNGLFPTLGHVYAGEAWRGFRLGMALVALIAAFRFLAVQPLGAVWFLLSGLALPIGIIVLGLLRNRRGKASRVVGQYASNRRLSLGARLSPSRS